MLVIFDCDGTLVDSQHIIIESMCVAFKQNSVTRPSDEEIRRIVGLSLPDAVESLTESEDEILIGNIVNSYRRAFFEFRKEKGVPESLFPNVVETLVLIREAGHLLGIATGKSRKGLINTLDCYAILDCFATLQTADDAPGKPNPKMLFRAMEETGFKRCDTIFIGDTVFDIEMAKNADIKGYGVSWGYHDESELLAAGAALIINNMKELPSLLE